MKTFFRKVRLGYFTFSLLSVDIITDVKPGGGVPFCLPPFLVRVTAAENLKFPWFRSPEGMALMPVSQALVPPAMPVLVHLYLHFLSVLPGL